MQPIRSIYFFNFLNFEKELTQIQVFFHLVSEKVLGMSVKKYSCYYIYNHSSITSQKYSSLNSTPTNSTSSLPKCPLTPSKLHFRFVMAFYYFGLSFLSVDLSEDRFTAFMLSAFVELPGEQQIHILALNSHFKSITASRKFFTFSGGLVVIPLMLYAGRRILCLSTMAIQGVAIIIAPFSRGELGTKVLNHCKKYAKCFLCALPGLIHIWT